MLLTELHLLEILALFKNPVRVMNSESARVLLRIIVSIKRTKLVFQKTMFIQTQRVDFRKRKSRIRNLFVGLILQNSRQ